MLRPLDTSSFETFHIHNCPLEPRLGKLLATLVQQVHDPNTVKQCEAVSFCRSAGRFRSSNRDDLLKTGNHFLPPFPCRPWLSTHWFITTVSWHSQKTLSISAQVRLTALGPHQLSCLFTLCFFFTCLLSFQPKTRPPREMKRKTLQRATPTLWRPHMAFT